METEMNLAIIGSLCSELQNQAVQNELNFLMLEPITRWLLFLIYLATIRSLKFAMHIIL